MSVKYRITAPDGTAYDVVAPDGTTQDQALARVRQQVEAQQPQQEAQAPEPPSPDVREPEQATFGETAVDMARVIPGGLAKGASYALGMGGDATAMLADATGMDRQALRGGIQAVGATTGLNNVFPIPFAAATGPTTEEYNQMLSAPTGGYYKPQTEGGRYVERGAEFAIGAAFPGSAAGRLARAAVPGVLSRFGEDELGPYGGVIGALAGGVATAPRALTSISQLARGVPRAERILLNTASRSEGGAEGVAQRAREFEQTGQPHTFLDVGGYGVQRVARAAAAGDGPAQDIANQYHRRMAAEAPEMASEAAYRLTPGDRRSPARAVSEIEAANDAEMATNYAQPYRTQVPWTPELERSLSGPQGEASIRRALEGAQSRAGSANIDVAKQAQAQVRELTAYLDYLRNPREAGRMRAVPRLSGASVDRIRIAQRESADRMERLGKGAVASGYQGRRAGVDISLDQVPEMREARAAARRGYTDIDAVELGGTALKPSVSSSDYASQLADAAAISPNARRNAAVGLRQSIVNNLENRPEGSMGAMNTVANTPRIQSNIAATVGQNVGNRFRTEVNQVAGRLERASQNRPGAGSRTAILQNDMQMLENVPTSSHGVLLRVFDLIRRGAPISDATRADIQRLVTSEAQVRRLVSRIPRGVSTRQYLAAMYAAQQPGMRGSQP